MALAERFANDRQGKRFPDVMNDARISFSAILDFFDDPDRQRRMVESEVHHDRPAIAGVVLELENRNDVREFFASHEGETTRFCQAVGVVVRIVMEAQGFKKTGRKGSLGDAMWFTRAERYELSSGMPFNHHNRRELKRILNERTDSFDSVDEPQ